MTHSNADPTGCLSHREIWHRRNIALSATLELNRMAGNHWLYYAADVLQHWPEHGSALEAAQGLRAAGDHCLAAMLIDVSGLDTDLLSLRYLALTPSHRLSRRDMAYRLLGVERRLPISIILKCFWQPTLNIRGLLQGMRDGGQKKLAAAFECELLADSEAALALSASVPPVRVPLPRLLSRKDMHAEEIASELRRSNLSYTEADVLAFWSPTTPALSIELMMRQAGEHVMARLFSEFALTSDELQLVLRKSPPDLADPLSEREMARIGSHVQRATGADVMALWRSDVPISQLWRRIASLHGPDVISSFRYWTLRHPGYECGEGAVQFA